MRRKEKEITERAEIEEVIAEAQVCHMAMCDGPRPYVVPLSFGYADQAFFFHCATAGRKLDILRQNPEVCLQLETRVGLKRGNKACEFGIDFRSVIAFGRAVFVEPPDDKRRALDLIMRHYAPGEFEYADAVLAKTFVIRVDVTHMTGKKSL
jgi:nitroimidazol reductase NimA-like FMN-containing flavoprotein (pyridoxamine 5'-phosphate oxidase superfamily)